MGFNMRVSHPINIEIKWNSLKTQWEIFSMNVLKNRETITMTIQEEKCVNEICILFISVRICFQTEQENLNLDQISNSETIKLLPYPSYK